MPPKKRGATTGRTGEVSYQDEDNRLEFEVRSGSRETSNVNNVKWRLLFVVVLLLASALPSHWLFADSTRLRHPGDELAGERDLQGR